MSTPGELGCHMCSSPGLVAGSCAQYVPLSMHKYTGGDDIIISWTAQTPNH